MVKVGVECCEKCLAGDEGHGRGFRLGFTGSWEICCCKTGGTIRLGWLYGAEGVRGCKDREHDDGCCVDCDLDRQKGIFKFEGHCCCMGAQGDLTEWVKDGVRLKPWRCSAREVD